MRDPTRLLIWQRSVALSVAVADAIPIRLARKTPGLRAQAVRAACQISEAIAEGCGKRTDRDFARFLDNAIGSTTELQTQIVLCVLHGIVTRAVGARLYREAKEIRKMIYAFRRNLLNRTDEKEP